MSVTYLTTVRQMASAREYNVEAYSRGRIEQLDSIAHSHDCPRHGQGTEPIGPGCTEWCSQRVRVTMFEGATFCDRERNFYDDSDFYVIAWDGEKLVYHEYASTRFAGGGHANVDATEETRALARDWLEHRYREQIGVADEAQAYEVTEGKWVVVRSGRNIAPGTEGRVLRLTEGRYGRERAQVEGADGLRFWIDSRHLAVADPASYLHSEEARAMRAKRLADQTAETDRWYVMFLSPGLIAF